ncbi:TerC family protein [Aerophototrophica crusticola]|uniref:TerC family protein n=1 Tax=Aerophototrophica crusticola TaxID=1709002 RepID=A0A858R989_9PROT|nr:TerC family protein [Rhodospirillaceae bacterium B3]
MDLSFLHALWQVILIDLVLAGDNAIVVGMAAAGVAQDKRRQVIFWGIAAAVVLRIIFALATTWLLQIVGLMLAGGILLLWVCWKLWREIRERAAEDVGAEVVAEGIDPSGSNPKAEALPAEGVKPVGVAIRQIIVADVSMSLDNVLAVAGAANEHPEVLVLGLALSVAFMGAAATLIAKLLEKYHWIAYVGLGVIAYVAVVMIYKGGVEVAPYVGMA